MEETTYMAESYISNNAVLKSEFVDFKHYCDKIFDIEDHMIQTNCTDIENLNTELDHIEDVQSVHSDMIALFKSEYKIFRKILYSLLAGSIVELIWIILLTIKVFNG